MTDADKAKVLEEAVRNMLGAARGGNLRGDSDFNYRFAAIASLATDALDRIQARAAGVVGR